jgi:hypothetical protein
MRNKIAEREYVSRADPGQPTSGAPALKRLRDSEATRRDDGDLVFGQKICVLLLEVPDLGEADRVDEVTEGIQRI